MRRLGRVLITALLTGLLWWYSSGVWQHLLQYWLHLTGPRIEQIASASSRLTYRLHDDAWTRFAIPAGATRLKVSTNANLPTALAEDPERTWPYAVAYELLDANGHVQAQHVYHHRSRVTLYPIQDTHETSPAAFYLDNSLKPADTRSLVVDLSGYPSATRVRFRTASKHELLTDVAMSIYARTPVAERKLGYLWRRLPREQKQRLARGLVFSTEFLNTSEQHQLLQNRWQALGPKGIERRDYHVRKLYVLKQIDPEPLSEPTLTRGLLVDPEHHGIIVIPPGGADLRLDFLTLSTMHPPPDSHGIQITWYGKQPHGQSHHTVAWQDNGTRFEHTFPPGLLELTVSEGATAVQVSRRENEQYMPWPIEPGQSRMYLVQPEQSVEFSIHHLGQKSTPFRIDVRHASPSTTPVAHPAVVYEWLTNRDEVVRTGQLISAATMSRYDRIPSLGPSIHVSDPSTSFFSIPPQVARIRFSLPSPSPEATLLIAAWNRPPDLVRELHLGLENETDHDAQRQWAWFPKRPTHAADLVTEHRSYLLHIQTRPPQAKPDLQTTAYQVEQYRPEGRWRGRYLFLPRAPDAPQRPEALAVTFKPLRAEREQRLELRGLPQLRYLQPKLIYFKDSVRPQTFEVFIDGASHFRGRVAGQRGEIDLPLLPAGVHRVRLTSELEARWYINHVVSSSPGHLRRLAYRFDTSGLSFIYDRQSAIEETLSMRWYAPHGSRQPARIHVQLALSATSRRTPSPHWTFHERRYVLAPLAGPPVPVLHTAAAQVAPGQPFFLPIGHDVPAGRYRIRMRLEQGSPGYITLAKLTPGAFESRRFFGEKVPQYVQTHP